MGIFFWRGEGGARCILLELTEITEVTFQMWSRDNVFRLCCSTPCRMYVQYNGDIMTYVVDILSTMGGYHDVCGGYYEYPEGLS